MADFCAMYGLHRDHWNHSKCCSIQAHGQRQQRNLQHLQPHLASMHHNKFKKRGAKAWRMQGTTIRQSNNETHAASDMPMGEHSIEIRFCLHR